MRACLAVLTLLTHSLYSFPDTLLVPTQFESVKAAVEAAESGDVIQLVSPEVAWGGPVTVENMELTIEAWAGLESARVKISPDNIPYLPGDEPIQADNPPKTLEIINSKLTLKEIDILKPIRYSISYSAYGALLPAQITVDRYSSLTLDECSMQCPITTEGDMIAEHSFINGYSAAFESGHGKCYHEIPSILLHSSSDKIIRFKFCTLSNDAYIPLLVKDVQNCRLELLNNTVLQAGNWSNRECRTGPPRGGSEALRIQNCSNIQLAGSWFYGGDAAYGGTLRSHSHLTEPAGHGASIIDSQNILLEQGWFYGADGYSEMRKGGFQGDNPATGGGHGVYIKDSSVTFLDFRAFGGRGGAGGMKSNDNEETVFIPPGRDGEPVYLEGDSTFLPADDAAVSNWDELHPN